MKSLRLIPLLVVSLVLGGIALWRFNAQTDPAIREEISRQENRPDSVYEKHREEIGSTEQSYDPPSFPSDSNFPSDPVAQATADGVILESHLDSEPAAGSWTRVRLVQTKVQPRPVRVVEKWTRAPGTGVLICDRRDMYLADQLIVKARPGISEEQFKQQLASLGLPANAKVSDRLFTIRLASHDLDAAPAALRLLAIHPEIAEAAEMDGVGFGGGIPNDSGFGEQWGLHNTGQSGGVTNADVDAPEFWDYIESTPGMVIAVIDSGLNFTHPDLQNIAWGNPAEIAGDGVDNDGNGLVDDVTGWDFTNGDNDPTDDQGHGSHVAGIIAATRNNSEGTAGLISGIRIMSCKVLNSSNSGLTSHLILGVTYARQHAVPVMNLSLQSYPYSSALDTEFTACQNAGILLCVCAGNQGVNNDVTPNYPSSYPHANIIAVGNHDRTDARWSGSTNPSNYGLTSVDLFAPGREILSPVLGTSYSSYTGTSMATPFVAAVAATLKYLHPTWGAPEIKERILASAVKRPAYDGICATGGRLNAFAALDVAGAPVFITQPSSQSVVAGTPCVFTATATGMPAPSYQWQKNGSNISGATNSSYTISSPVSGDAGSYTVVATNSIGSATSNAAILTIIVPPSNAVISITVQ